MSKKQPPYAPEYRRQMVELVRTGRTPGELAGEFECSASAIRNWVRQADRDEGRREDGLTSLERKELRELRRENRQLREEREILKKRAKTENNAFTPAHPMTIAKRDLDDAIRAPMGSRGVSCSISRRTSSSFVWRKRARVTARALGLPVVMRWKAVIDGEPAAQRRADGLDRPLKYPDAMGSWRTWV